MKTIVHIWCVCGGEGGRRGNGEKKREDRGDGGGREGERSMERRV